MPTLHFCQAFPVLHFNHLFCEWSKPLPFGLKLLILHANYPLSFYYNHDMLVVVFFANSALCTFVFEQVKLANWLFLSFNSCLLCPFKVISPTQDAALNWWKWSCVEKIGQSCSWRELGIPNRFISGAEAEQGGYSGRGREGNWQALVIELHNNRNAFSVSFPPPRQKLFLEVGRRGNHGHEGRVR